MGSVTGDPLIFTPTKQNTRRWARPLFFLAIGLAALFQVVVITSDLFHSTKTVTLRKERPDPGYGWKDDIWPLRPQQPWDISTDFPHPRKLTYDVEEGTWLRLDVSPKGEIVFDMLGDIYCLPASSFDSTDTTRALPILTGIPHDSDPHFSPDGNTLVFRSDAGLGVENIWAMPWKGCESSALRSYDDTPYISQMQPELVRALTLEEEDNMLLNSGFNENDFMKRRRLTREGRAEAFRVTNETYRWVSDARFHPSGNKIIATKWYTSSRSLGAGEGWEYNLPTLSDTQITPANGTRLIGRTLPFGWSPEQYENQQIGPEQFIWWGDDRIIYAKNVAEDGSFEYSKDVYKGIYAIFSYNITSGVTKTLVNSSPGGASRPELSRDGKTLAFVRRVRDKEALVLQHLESGTIRNIWYGLTYDLSSIFAPMGTYPSFAFSPNDDAIIIWSTGSIWSVPLTINSSGERVGNGLPRKIKWKATIEKQLAETRYTETSLLSEETKATQRLHSFKDLSVDDTGSKAVFQGAGANYYIHLRYPVHQDNTDEVPLPPLDAVPVPTVHPTSVYYAPSFVPHLPHLVIQTRWTDSDFSSFELADLNQRTSYEIKGLPFGRYTLPTLCRCNGLSRRIAFVRMGGDDMTGRVVATAGAGVYVGSIVLPSPDAEPSSSITVHDLKLVSTETPSRLSFVDGATKLIMHTDQSATAIDLTTSDSFGQYKSKTLAEGRMSSEFAITPTTPRVKSAHFTNPAIPFASLSPAYVAFADFFQVYVAEGDKATSDPVWSKPGPKATKGLARVSVDGGHDLAWSGDGSRLYWFLGPYLHSLEVSKLSQCSKAIAEDPSNFGIQCTRDLLDVHDINVTYETDVSRIKKEAKAAFKTHASQDDLEDPELESNSDILAIVNATLATMETGKETEDIISGASLIVRGGVIQQVGKDDSMEVPRGAKVINAQGGVVVPGFVDVHAHWNGDYTVASSWEHRTFLAYGCTTVHNPSLDNVDAWAERGRVEKGMMVGPRIFTTGLVVYGAGEAGYHQDIADEAEARSALIRIKVEGGPYSFSYKNYQLPSRASRQRLIKFAKSLGMLVVPEGGMNYDWDLTYILDGMTTVEHSLPIPVLYDDVMTLFAKSGTGNTPTHLVNYGGASGEQLVWSHHSVPNDEKLRNFVPHESLEGITQSVSRPIDGYQLFNYSSSVYEMTKRGLNANIGAHGEPPLGLNYHAEMFFFHKGGMTPYETLRSASRSGALSLGLFNSIGSLSKNKLADMVVYPPGADILNDITLSKDPHFVIRGGRVWTARDMVEEWPVKGRTQSMPPLNAD